jgi:hypothetical protein
MSRRLNCTHEGGGHVGCFVGGLPPVGVVPRPPALEYMLTVPFWIEEERVSVFNPPHDNFLELVGRWQSTGIEVIRHPIRPRGDADHGARTDMSGHGLLVGPEERDTWEEWGEPDPVGWSKIGGEPSFMRARMDLRADYEQLKTEGFRLLVQIEDMSPLPGEIDVMEGSWPLSQGRMFVLARMAPSFEIRWLWQL